VTASVLAASAVLVTAWTHLLGIFSPMYGQYPTHFTHSPDESYGIYECHLLRNENCLEGWQPYCSRHMRQWGIDCVANAIDLQLNDDARMAALRQCGVRCDQEE
jgi:hypothetical protein